MKRITALIMCVCVLCAFLPLTASAAPQTVLNVYNWGEYIELSVLEMFEEENPDIKINYTTFDSNEAMYSKIVSGAASYDIVIPSDYMVSKLIQEDMLAPLDFENIPNYEYIDDTYKNQSYDPDNTYSVPYFWGTVVIIYNAALVDEEDYGSQSIDLLWNEKYAGKILMFDNPRDAFALALLKLGYSMNSESSEEWEQAAQLLREQKPLIQAYVMDAIFDKMESGEAWIAPYYAGDAIIIQETNPDVDFYIPKEGTNLFIDAMCVLKTSEHKQEAERFINFMCRPDVAAMNSDTVGYATPSSQAKELLDEEITSNELVYPDREFLLEHTDVFVNLSQKTQMLQSELWTNLKIESSEEGAAASFTAIDGFSLAALAVMGVSGAYLAIRNVRRRRLWKASTA